MSAAEAAPAAVQPDNRAKLPRGRGMLGWTLIGVTFAYYAFFQLYPQFLPYIGVPPYGMRYLDLFAILAANDALAMGRDVFLPNPLDPFGRPHSYSSWWLLLGNLGITRADNGWLGLTICICFFLAAVFHLKPRSGGELAWQLAIVCSPPVMLALNRANNDLVVFVILAPLVWALLHPERSVQWLSLLLVAFAAGLKFYPAAAGLLMLAGHDRGAVRDRVIALAIVLGLVGAAVASDITRYAAPDAKGIMTFSAAQLLGAIGLQGRAGTLTGIAVVLIGAMAFWRTTETRSFPTEAEGRANWLRFVLGAVLLLGCFLLGKNFSYRWIFAVWLAPFVWTAWHDETTDPALRRMAKVTAALLLFILWFDPAVGVIGTRLTSVWPLATVEFWIDRIALWEQPVFWALFGCLLFFLTRFVHQAWSTLGKGQTSRSE